MIEVYEFIQRIGISSLDHFWFPLFVWSIVGVLTLVILRFFPNINPLYHYHLRVATIVAIPLGFITKYLLQFFSNTSVINTSLETAVFIVNNPLELANNYHSTATSYSPSYTEPNFLFGLITLAVLLGSLVLIVRLFYSLLFIKRLNKKLSTQSLGSFSDFKNSKFSYVNVAYLEHPMVPFTYGWRNPVIVLPKSIQDDPEKIRMAIQHELVHIKRGDYLLQLILSVIESVFWFHPVIRFGTKEIEIYREISCDQEVLNTTGISLKSYASMLYELIPLNRGFGSFSVNMAVQQSTLKKRISTMKYHKLYRSSVKRSSLFFLLICIGIIAPIACSDMRAPSTLDESVLEDMTLTLASPTFEINGKELTAHPNTTSINGLDGFMFSVPEYGVFVVSPVQFEGGVLNGDIELNTIDFRINSMDVTIRSKGVINDNIIPVYINHYANLQGDNYLFGKLANQILVRKDLASYLVPPNGPTSASIGKVIPGDTFSVVEEMPKLIGGLASIQSRVSYPDLARKEGIEGRVVLQFVVTKDGKVINPEVIRGIGAGCDEAALEAIKHARFEPGMQRGKAVDVQFQLPIVFKLSDSEFGEKQLPRIKEIG